MKGILGPDPRDTDKRVILGRIPQGGGGRLDLRARPEARQVTL